MILLKILALLLAALDLVHVSSCQQEQMAAASNDLINGQDTVRGPQTNPLAPGSASGSAGLRPLLPLVDLEKDREAKRLDVHVPVFFDMTKSTSAQGRQLDLSVLRGLVTVQNRLERDQESGSMSGPLKVSVLGFPVYWDKIFDRLHGLVTPILAEMPGLQNQPGSPKAEPNEWTRRLAQQVQTTNSRLTDLLSKFVSRISGKSGESLPLTPEANMETPSVNGKQ